MRSIVLGFVSLLAGAACHGSGNEVAPQGSATAPEPSIDPVVDRARAEQADAEQKMQAAVAATNQARADAKAAGDKVEKLAKALEDQQAKLDAAVNMVVNATTQADRATAKAALAELQKEHAAALAEVAAAKRGAEQAERAKGVKISPECVQNPLAKGCS